MSKGIGGHLRRSFVRGLFVLIPVVLTYMVLKLLFDIVDGVLQPLVERGFGSRIPGLGILFLVVLVYLVGLLLANVLGRRMVELLKRGLLSIPVVGNVYSTAGKLIDSFSGSSDMGFKRVVAIEHPRKGAWTLGFLTSFIEEAPSKRMAIIYIPTAPMPNSGWVAILPVEEVYDTDLSIDTAMNLVLSGGITAPSRYERMALAED